MERLLMRSPKILLTIGCFLAFFAFGFIDNLKGPILPELIRADGLSMSQGGTVFFGSYLGFIAATILTGLLSQRFGNQRVLLLAGVLLNIGLVGASFSKSYSILVLMMGIVGLGLGAIELGANGLIVEQHPKDSGRYLNLLATFHGTGSFLVPLYVAWLIDIGIVWKNILLSVVMLSGALTIWFLLSQSGSLNVAGTIAKLNWRTILRVGFKGKMPLYYLLISFYVAVELGLAAWMMEYLQQLRGKSVSQSSIYLSAFFALIMLGRLAGSFVVEKIGYQKVVGIALLGGSVCLLAGFSGPDGMLIALPLSGLFFSIVFPTVTAIVTGLHQENIGIVLGILFTFGGIGGAVGPWSIGLVSQTFGLSVGMYLTIAFSVVAYTTLAILGQGNDRNRQ